LCSPESGSSVHVPAFAGTHHAVRTCRELDFDSKINIGETHLSRLRSKLIAGFGEDAIEKMRGTD